MNNTDKSIARCVAAMNGCTLDPISSGKHREYQVMTQDLNTGKWSTFTLGLTSDDYGMIKKTLASVVTPGKVVILLAIDHHLRKVLRSEMFVFEGT